MSPGKECKTVFVQLVNQKYLKAIVYIQTVETLVRVRQASMAIHNEEMARIMGVCVCFFFDLALLQ